MGGRNRPINHSSNQRRRGRGLWKGIEHHQGINLQNEVLNQQILSKLQPRLNCLCLHFHCTKRESKLLTASSNYRAIWVPDDYTNARRLLSNKYDAININLIPSMRRRRPTSLGFCAWTRGSTTTFLEFCQEIQSTINHLLTWFLDTPNFELVPVSPNCPSHHNNPFNLGLHPIGFHNPIPQHIHKRIKGDLRV